MLLQSSKIISASQLQSFQQVSAISPSNKFKRVNTKLSNDQTNFTSQKSQSMLSQITNSQKMNIITRKALKGKVQNAKLSTQNSQQLNILPKESKRELQSIASAQNFMKKTQLTLNTQSISSPSKQTTIISPKYNNKINTESAFSQDISAKDLVQKVVLKKAFVVYFVANRIIKSKLKNGLKMIGEKKLQIKLIEKEKNILLLSTAQFWRRLEKKLKCQAINRLKLITAKKGKQTYLFQNEFIKMNGQKRRDYLPNDLNLLERNKIGNAFKSIKKNMLNKRVVSKVYPTLFDFYEKRKIKDAFGLFKLFLKGFSSRKLSLLTQIESCFKFCTRVGLSKAFKRIILFAGSINNKNQIVPSNSLLMNEQESRKNQKRSQIQYKENQIKLIQQKATKQKRDQQNECNKIKKQIEQLKRSNLQINEQLKIKKSMNNQLKQQIDHINEVSDGNSQEKQGQIQRLQQLYCQIYKLTQEDIKNNLSTIMDSYQIHLNEPNMILKQWQLIQQKNLLQSQIDCYQSQVLGPKKQSNSNIGKQLKQQNKMIKQMIKNYIKQRYLWGEVQKFVSTIK